MNLLNPWVIVGWTVSLVAAFFFGIYMEHGRFMGFVAKVEAVGEVAAKESAKKKADDEKLKKEKDDAHKHNEEVLAGINADLERKLRDARARGSVVPAAGKAAGRGDESGTERICFKGEELRAGVERILAGFEDGAVRRIQESAAAMNNFSTCAAWAQESVRR